MKNKQNHNYADWDLTSLLPENLISFPGVFWYEDRDEDRVIYHESDIYDQLEGKTLDGFVQISTAWSWEDIRVYLQNKGYIIVVKPYVDEFENEDDESIQQILWEYRLITHEPLEINDEFYSSDDYYHEYEEAREAAIRHCLKLIKE